MNLKELIKNYYRDATGLIISLGLAFFGHLEFLMLFKDKDTALGLAVFVVFMVFVFRFIVPNFGPKVVLFGACSLVAAEMAPTTQ